MEEIKDIKIKLCRLCLNKIDGNNYEVIKEVTKEIFDILLLDLILDDRNVEVMCCVCFKKLLAAFQFKSTCLYTEDIIFPYINSSETSSLDLREIYLKEKGKQLLLNTSQKICRLCMEPVKRNFKSIQKVDVIMFQKFLPEMNFIIIMDPIVCNDCRVSFTIHNKFLKNCLDVEKIFKNSDTVSIDSLYINVADEKGEDSGFAGFEENMENQKTPKGKLVNISSKFQIRRLLNKDFRLKFKCDKCQFETKFKCSLRRHELKHEKPSSVQMYKCYQCKFTTKYISSLAKHRLTHKGQTYKCNDCTFETKHKISLERHQLKHKDPSQIQMYKCIKCKFETKHKESLARHQLTHKEPSQVQMYKCIECKFETKYKMSIERHQLLHNDPSQVQMYKCIECKFETKYKMSIERHQLLHNDPSQVQMYKCSECTFKTKHKEDLQRHRLIHKDPSQVQMYKCSECRFETKHKRAIKKHHLTHKDPSQVKVCKSKKCRYKVNRKHNLQRHQMRHTVRAK